MLPRVNPHGPQGRGYNTARRFEVCDNANEIDWPLQHFAPKLRGFQWLPFDFSTLMMLSSEQ
jgi:hypothetical protein